MRRNKTPLQALDKKKEYGEQVNQEFETSTLEELQRVQTMERDRRDKTKFGVNENGFSNVIKRFIQNMQVSYEGLCFQIRIIKGQDLLQKNM